MLTRDQERQLEVYALMRPFESPDFEEVAYQMSTLRRAERRQEYRDMQLFDPMGWRQLLEKQAAKARERYGLEASSYRPRSSLKERDVREMRQMYASGARIAAISRAFRVSRSAVLRAVSGKTFTQADGPVHGRRKPGQWARPELMRGANHWRAKLTPELVERVLLMKGTLRGIGAALGIDKRTVSKIKAGETWLQRAEAAQ